MNRFGMRMETHTIEVKNEKGVVVATKTVVDNSIAVNEAALATNDLPVGWSVVVTNKGT